MRLEGAEPGEQGGTSGTRSFGCRKHRFTLASGCVLSSCLWFLILKLRCQMANEKIIIRTSTRCLRLTPPDFRPTTQKWSYFYVPVPSHFRLTIQLQVISSPLYKNQVTSDPHKKIKTFQTPYTISSHFRTTIQKPSPFRPPIQFQDISNPLYKNQVILDPPYNFKSFQTPLTKTESFPDPLYKNRAIANPLSKYQVILDLPYKFK